MLNNINTRNINMLYSPALNISEASGKEQKSCIYCDNKTKKGEKIIELFSSEFKGKLSYTKRFHYRCWLKTLAQSFPELLSEHKKLVKEIMLEKMEDND